MSQYAHKSGLFSYTPSTDVAETPKQISITSDLPGMKKEDITLAIER